MRVMKIQIIGVRFHEFQVIKQRNNVFLAKCNCCSKARWAVFVTNNNNRMFWYHGHDQQYAQKLFSSLVSRFNSQSQV
jgi:hypothetical protein